MEQRVSNHVRRFAVRNNSSAFLFHFCPFRLSVRARLIYRVQLSLLND